MTSVKSDIVNNFKHNKIYKKYEHILKDLSDYEYDKEWVNAPSAFGDTYKYSVVYTIGDFKFKYHHVLASEINSSEFCIKYIGKEKQKTHKELLFEHSLMMTMMARFKRKSMPDFPLNTALLNKFKNKYKLKTDDEYYLLFTILNSFTFGQCVSIRIVDEKHELVHQSLDELIDIV